MARDEEAALRVLSIARGAMDNSFDLAATLAAGILANSSTLDFSEINIKRVFDSCVIAVMQTLADRSSEIADVINPR